MGPGFRVFRLHVIGPTNQCRSVSQYIGRKCIAGSWEALCQWRRGHKAPSNRKSRIPTAVIGGVLVVRPTQSAKVLSNLEALPSTSRTGSDGTDGTCESQIVCTSQNRQNECRINQGPGFHKALSIAMRRKALRADCDVRTCAAMGHRSTLIARHVGTTVKG